MATDQEVAELVTRIQGRKPRKCSSGSSTGMPSLTLLKTCGLFLSFSGSTLLTPHLLRAAASCGNPEIGLAVLEARAGVEKPQRRGRWGLGFRAISSHSSFDSMKKGIGSPVRLCCIKRMGRQVPGREAQDRNCLTPTVFFKPLPLYWRRVGKGDPALLWINPLG